MEQNNEQHRDQAPCPPVPGPEFGRVLAEIGFGIYTRGSDPEDLFWSAGMFKILGVDADSCKPSQDKIEEMVVAEDRSEFVAAFEEMESGPGEYNHNCRIELSDGTVKHIQINVLVEWDKSCGRLIQLGAVKELSAEDAADRQLNRLRKDHFSLLTENLPGVVYLCKNDERWTMLFLNEAIEELTGYPRDEFLKNRISYADVIHPDDVSGVFDQVQQALDEGRQFQLRYRIIHRDGSTRWVEETGDALRRDGRVLFLEGYIGDVTERRRSEEQLKESEEMLRTLSDATFESIFLSDKGVCIGQNRTAEKIFGYSAEEALGRMGTEWIHPDHRDHVLQQMMAGVEEPYTSVALRKDGTTFPCEIQGRMMEHKGRQIRVTSLRDITRRKLAEEELQESRERYMLALQGAALGTWDWDIPTSRVDFNDRWAEMLGYRPDELEPTVTTWKMLLNPEDSKRVMEVLNDHLEGKTVEYETEHRLRHKDGHWVWVHDRGKVIKRDADGRPVRAVGTHLDITDRVNSELNYAQILETATDGFWIVDSRGFIREANSAAALMLGYKPDDLAGLHVSVIDAIEDDAAVITRIMQITRRGAMRFETRHLCRDGSILDVDVSASYLPVDNGQFVVFVRDISEQKQSARRLRESEERTRSVFDAVSDAVFMHPLMEEGFASFVDVNSTACERYGYTREEFLHLDATNISKPADARSHARPSHRSMLKKTGRMTFEAIHVKKSGEEFPVEINSAVTEVDGQPMIIAVVRDITARKQAETEKAQLEEQLRQIQKIEALGVLAGGIAHDFNNILFAILGYAEFAKRQLPKDHRVHNLLGEIIQSSHRASDLVKQILTYARRTDRKRQDIDIVPIVKEVHKLIRKTLPANIDIELEQEVDRATVMADPTEIHQVLMNLCTNARQAISGDSGMITLKLEAVNIEIGRPGEDAGQGPFNYFRIEVSDTGEGIPEEIRGQIFDPFFTTKEVGQGTGMGLAVVQSVVGELRGWVEVESETGRGTSFIVHLPMAASEPKAEVADGGELPGGTERVIVVDDEPAIANLVRFSLEDLGYQVEAFIDSTLALQRFGENPDDFQLAILDLAMPKITGGELAERMIKLKPDLPVIIATGYSETFPESKALALGIKRYLDKPVRLEALARTVRDVLDDT